MRSTEVPPIWRQVPAGLKRGLVEVCRAGLDFVYPPACLLCRREIESQSVPWLCLGCRKELAPFILDACQRCGAPVGPNLDTSLGCVHCRHRPFHFDRLIRLGVYKDSLRGACLRIKHPGTEPVARSLADLLWIQEREAFESLDIDRVISVPQHWTRRIWRGHNAAEVLARQLSRRLGVRFDRHRVVKTRRTPKQATLPGSRRLKNLREAFRLRRPAVLKDQHILLVDDVLTTGTTVNRISRLLRKAKVKTITVAVIARSYGEAR